MYVCIQLSMLSDTVSLKWFIINSVQTQNNSCLKHNLTPLITQFQSLFSYVCLHWSVTNKLQSASLKETLLLKLISRRGILQNTDKQSAYPIFRPAGFSDFQACVKMFTQISRAQISIELPSVVDQFGPAIWRPGNSQTTISYFGYLNDSYLQRRGNNLHIIISTSPAPPELCNQHYDSQSVL